MTAYILKATYIAAQYKWKQSIRNYEIKREQKIIDSNNIGSFYSFVSMKLSCKKGVGALRDEQGNRPSVTNDASRAYLLNTYFSSVCVKDDGTSPNITRAVPDSMSIDNVYFTPILFS